MANPVFAQILGELRCFAATAKSLRPMQEFLVDAIAGRLSAFDWVGFYMLDPDHETVLVLGPFRGAPTDHIRIPVTQGICGAAVAQGETVTVGDVSRDPRYLSCSVETKSEIVVPLRIGGRIVGEIDIDSHTLNAFGPEDRTFLEECAEIIQESIRIAGAPLRSEIEAILDQALPRGNKAQRLARIIRDFGSYRRVGLYDVYPEAGVVSNIAWDGPHPPTHLAFPMTCGLTSRAIARARSVNVGDVLTDPSYLTTLDSTRSELIIPVLADLPTRVLGTIDVESDRQNAFDWGTQILLEDCARMLTGFWINRSLSEAPGVPSTLAP